MNASRGRIQKYENLKRKLYKCNANIYFNQQCLKKQLTPAYAHIKVPNTSPAHIHTQRKIPAIRIKDEIKHLHVKKTEMKPRTILPALRTGKHIETHVAYHTRKHRRQTPYRNVQKIQNPGQETA